MESQNTQIKLAICDILLNKDGNINRLAALDNHSHADVLRSKVFETVLRRRMLEERIKDLTYIALSVSNTITSTVNAVEGMDADRARSEIESKHLGNIFDSKIDVNILATLLVRLTRENQKDFHVASVKEVDYTLSERISRMSELATPSS